MADRRHSNLPTPKDVLFICLAFIVGTAFQQLFGSGSPKISNQYIFVAVTYELLIVYHILSYKTWLRLQPNSTLTIIYIMVKYILGGLIIALLIVYLSFAQLPIWLNQIPMFKKIRGINVVYFMFVLISVLCVTRKKAQGK